VPLLRILVAPFLVTLLSGCIVEAPSESPPHLTARLSGLLHDPAVDVRRTAAQALGKVGHPDGMPALRDALRDPDARVRQYAAWGLGMIGEPARESAAALIPLLRDHDRDVSAAAAWAIGQIGAAEAVVDQLVIALKAVDPADRRAAVTALGWLEAPASMPALLAALEDGDAAVRQGAIAALGELGATEAVPRLIILLQRDRERAIRNEAAYRLGKLGDGRAEPALRQAARNPGTALWAGWALQQLTEGSN
jgi:HEAT repeat protein